MRRYIPVFVAASLAANIAGANDLSASYQLATTRDPQLQSVSFQRDAAVEQRAQDRSRLLPQLSTNATAARERGSFDVNAPQAPPAGPCELSANNQTEVCTGNLHGYGATLTQTLWSFESISRFRASSSQAAGAEAILLGAEQNLVLRVARVYFAILAARDQVTTNRNERTAFGELLKQAKDRVRTGVGPQSDVQQAQAFYDTTEQSVIDAENALDEAKLALTELVGTYKDEIAPLRAEIPLNPPDPSSADSWVAVAHSDNLSLNAARLRVQAADREIAASVGKGLPTLALVGSTSHLWQDQSLGGNQRVDSIGISFVWPLFQGGAVAAAVGQSRALYRQAQADYEAAQRDIERQTRAAYRGVVTGIQRVAAARRAVESGRVAVEASRRNVDFGTGTEFDLLNAQNNYYAAQRAYSQARYDYLISLLTLKQQAGHLYERDLAQVDEMLLASS